MKTIIEKTLLLSITQAITMLDSHTADAFIHIRPNNFCENATKVSYRDAFCQEDINYEILNGRSAELFLAILAFLTCMLGVTKGYEYMQAECEHMRITLNRAQTRARNNASFWHRENPQTERLTAVRVADDGYGTQASETENVPADTP
jgi:hypothetical protein